MYIPSGRSSTLLGRAVYLVAAFLLASILHSSIISASPISTNQQLDVTEQLHGTSKADGSSFPVQRRDEDKYPDLEECRKKCNIGADKSVFYSKVGKHEEKPQDFANENAFKLVRDAYPKGFTDKNPKLTKYTAFAQRFSQAYAEKTSGTAYVLLPTDGKTAVGNVWKEYEKPFLVKDGGKCNRIIKVDSEDFSKKCVLWDREGKEDEDMAKCDSEIGAIPTKDKSSATDICGDWYKVVLDYFEIRGKNFDPTKFGKDGSGLEKQIKGCGKLTRWHFEYTPHDPRFAWYAHGQLPIGTKACVGRAVVSAGGEGPGGCTGAG